MTRPSAEAGGGPTGRPPTGVVVLVRHGAAESGEEGADHERRLTAAGRQAAEEAGRWLAERIPPPDLAWVSSAVRARSTWEALAAAVPAKEVRVERSLYQAGSAEVVDGVVSAGVPTMVVVGHNPTLEHALAALTGELRGLRAGAAAVVDLTARRLTALWEPPA